ncbi:MAG: MBL fold metallo-hydrolase [Clostridiales bacterium]|nr:MBL fold metallo-hydrolase [Clostridiales bacterium]
MNKQKHINFFCHEQFSDRLYIFNEGYSMVHRFTIGVIVGDDKAMVIDAGLGMTQGLRSYIESVIGTDKPLLLACTNGRRDHVGSACQFEDRYCSMKDIEIDEGRFDPIRRYMDFTDYCLTNPIDMEYCKAHMIYDNQCDFNNVTDGCRFDLGGVTVEAIAVAGVTPGSMAFYCAAEKACFTGDAINTDVWMLDADFDALQKYAEAMDHFVERVHPDTTVWPYHLPEPMEVQIAKNLAVIARQICNRQVELDPPCSSMFWPLMDNRNWRGHYFNNTCIVYDRSHFKFDLRFNSLNSCYYSHEKWSDRVYTITINSGTVNRITLMVFVGDEKILCIDSGHGIDGKLVDYIKQMTGKPHLPIALACTHVGIDHAGGAIQFKEIYLHQNDINKLPMSRNRRLVDVQPFSNYCKEFEEYTTEYILEPVYPSDCRAIHDGDLFELGGLNVECIFTPGHSDGHMAFYCASEKVCMTGDAMNVDTHLGGTTAQFYRDYADMLQRFTQRVNPDTRLWASHLNRPDTLRIPRNIRAACLEIADQINVECDCPAEAIQHHIGKFRNPGGRMHYHGINCVIYNSGFMSEQRR